MPVGFAMQMPLRIASTCLQAAKRQVLEWHATESLPVDEDSESPTPALSLAQVPPHPELVALANKLGDVDTKFDAFAPVVKELIGQGKQIMVFTFSRQTLAYLKRRLQSFARVAVLHGGVAKEARQTIMADFRQGGYDLVLANRVASEGLDFEFCSAVVNYDLPWNPMEVEQRIGRIDRIGQREAKIHIVNFHTPGTIETDIISRVMERIGVFERSIGELEPILQSRVTDLQQAIFDFSLTSQQRERRTAEILAAIEEKNLACADVESASSYLISTDRVDIDGLETGPGESWTVRRTTGAGVAHRGLGGDRGRRSRHSVR
jgi:superfamily II DNA/RNA helicase